jgi:hypothetical protein
MKKKFEDILSTLGIEVYATPVEEGDVIVLLGRLAPLNDRDTNLKLSESRLLNYLERALVAFEKIDNVKVRFSRPWLLKKGKLAYTWDFTFRGDLNEALKILKSTDIPSNPSEKVTSGPIQSFQPKRGKVKAVTIGRLV